MKRWIWMCTAVLALTASCGFHRSPGDLPEPGEDAAYRDNLLAAISPALAATGDIVTLEGTFGRASGSAPVVIVQFPTAKQPIQTLATVLGLHRAQVAVPAGAIDGTLIVIVDGVAMPPVVFHHATYTLGVGVFGNLAQPAAAAQSLGPIAPRSGHTSAVIGDHVYVIGGIHEGALVAAVERARISADGTLGAFGVVAGVTLVTPRYAHTSVVIGSYLYVLGGSDLRDPLRSVERAPIDADGALGAFAVVSDTALATARYGHTSEVIGDQLYAIGGRGAAGELDSIERAEIRRDGTIGGFAAIAGGALTSRRGAPTSAVVGTSLYVVGGFDGDQPLGTVERAAIHGDGTLGGFAEVPGAVLATPRSGHTSVVLGASLFVIGGTGRDGAVSTVEQSGLDPGGAMGGFTAIAATALAPATSGHTSAVVGNYLYVIGGHGDAGVSEQVQRASIDGDGSLAGFANYPLVLFPPRAFHTAAVIGRSLYLLGGTAGLTVAWALIGTDGQLISFIPAGTTIAPHFDHGSAVIGKYLYLIGGNLPNTVERAAINPDASLGAFATVPGVTPAAGRASFCTAVVKNYVYVVGGIAGTSSLASVERAPIGADGGLGKFEAVASTLTTARHGFVCVVIGPSLYAIAGANATAGTVTAVKTIERASIADDGSLGAFQPVPEIAVTEARIHAGAAVIGDYLYLLGGEPQPEAPSPSTTIERAKISATGPIASFAAYPDAALSSPRWSAATVVVDHGVYVIGGSTGTFSNTVDHAVFPAPPAR